MGARRLKAKTCRARECGKEFSPYNSLEKVCSVKCAIAFAKDEAEKKAERERRKEETRVKRERRAAKENNRGWALAQCQRAFNELIRFLDRDLPCVTCGTTNQNIKYDCGHYKTRGAHPELRFRRENCARQCSKDCNLHNGGRPVEFREAIIKRWGQEVVDILEGPKQLPNWTVEEIHMIKSACRAQLKYEKRKAGYD